MMSIHQVNQVMNQKNNSQNRINNPNCMFTETKNLFIHEPKISPASLVLLVAAQEPKFWHKLSKNTRGGRKRPPCSVSRDHFSQSDQSEFKDFLTSGITSEKIIQKSAKKEKKAIVPTGNQKKKNRAANSQTTKNSSNAERTPHGLWQ